MVERIAGWSTRHRKIAVFGWLAMVLAIVALGQLMGSRNLPVYDPGQAGQGEQALHHVAPATLNQLSESVLVQGRPPGRGCAGRTAPGRWHHPVAVDHG
jgi:putative drug exporter of the RND superfamily